MPGQQQVNLAAQKTVTVTAGADVVHARRADDATIAALIPAGSYSVFGPYSKDTVVIVVGDTATIAVSDVPVFEADTITTDYTVNSTDQGKLLKVNSSSSVTITLPATLPEGFGCSIARIGTGAVTFSAGSGATMNSAFGATGISAQYGVATIMIYSNASGTAALWLLAGLVS